MAGPWTDPGSFGFYISAWVVMMAAMMLPSSVPMVLGPSRGHAANGQRGWALVSLVIKALKAQLELYA